MTLHRGAIARLLPLLALVFAALTASAQGGNAGAIRGTVSDPSGAVVPNAAVRLTNVVSEFDETTSTDSAGQFAFPNVPFNPYKIEVSAKGFATLVQSVEIRSSVGISIKLVLQISGGSQTVTVQSGGDLIEDDPTFHVDVDRDLFNKVPLESASSTLSSLVTLTTPGVAADSNGLFHGLGDHASNSFSVDGQSITDQQSKIFSNQLPSNSIQSIEVISGAPPAEYGDKTSLVIVATTRSGEGVTKPSGSIYGSYGSFGSAAGGFDLSYGGKSWGNFIEADALNTGRFLDPPEFTVFHDKGNEQNFFDRIDYSFSSADSIHWDLNYSRSWFQTPNSFDNLNVSNVVGGGTSASPTFANVGNTDQLSKINTYDVSPTYTHVISNDSVFNVGAFIRRDGYGYYPSGNPLADLGPIQTSSISQYRTLTNAGIHSDYSYVKGIHNLKIGAQYEQTFLREHDNLGVVDSTYNAPCVASAADNTPEPGLTDPSQCAGAGFYSNDPSVIESDGNPGTFNSVLLPYDLTRAGKFYHYFGHTDVKELAVYIEDEIKAGNWDFNLGLREDLYNALTDANQTEPRVGIAYNIKPSGTVMAVSYARTLETPFNENLVLSSSGCSDAVLNPLLSCSPGVSGTLAPGFRNEFHASLQQALGKYAVFGGEYIWKYTHNAFDFSILGNTPIFFPIDWHNSKIPGYALHVEVPQIHGISAYTVMSSVAARFFPPQSAGAGATVGQSGTPFRIDHDEKFNQTTHLQYTVSRHGHWVDGLWSGFNWRYDSGLVAGSVPFATDTTTPVDLSGLTADQQFEAGITCDGVAATLANGGFTSCDPAGYTSKLVQIPAPGTENDDHNPPRIAPRNLFDATVGKNNIFNKEHFKTDLDLTAINVTNKYALYNFLSTFSGTHYVTPRALTAKVTFNF
jgi:hypothetical protein